jgi:ATP-dependent Zn protease
MRAASLLLSLVLLAVIAACAADDSASTLPYSELLREAAADRVEAVVQDGQELHVTLADREEPVRVVIGERTDARAELCQAAGQPDPAECRIRYEFVTPGAAGQWLGLLITALLPVLLIGTFIFFMMRRAQATAQTRR